MSTATATAPIGSRPIEELELTVRAYNRLKRDGINTVAELTECTAADLNALWSFGAASLANVAQALAAHGLTLAGGGQ